MIPLTRRPKQPTAAAILALWLVVVAALTLRSDRGAAVAAAASPWWCLLCGESGLADFVLNLVLFVPVGVGLRIAGRGPLQTGLIGLGTSIGIEVTQAVALLGRDAALGDVIANTVGTAAGWWLVSAISALRHRWVAPAFLAVFGLQLIATPWLNHPAAINPRSLDLRVAPAIAGRPVYDGSVERFAVREERLVDGGSRGRHRPDAALAASFTWAAPTGGAAVPILRLDDRHGWAVVALGQDDATALLSQRTRAGEWRLRHPTWGIVAPTPIADGDTTKVALLPDRGRVTLAIESPGGQGEATLRFGAQHGWVVLNPWTPVATSDDSWRWWTALWLAGWGVPIGWGAAARRRPLAWGSAAVVVFLVITFGSGSVGTLLETASLAAGWLAGFRTARFLRSLAGA